MGQDKKWCIGTISIMAAILILVATAVVIVDPFFHYHKPLTGISYQMTNQTYINPGIVKQFEYDALITGSSMAENFKPSYFKDILGVNAIKVCYSGGRSKNMSIILQKALESNPQLQTIYLGLDLPMLKEADASKTRNPLPDYLYDANVLNDVSYLLNKDIVLEKLAVNMLATVKGEPSTTFDVYSYWNDEYTFSQYTVISPYEDMERVVALGYSLDEAIRIADNNLRQNILPLIEAYPDTKFVIFYPPYSMIYWYSNVPEYDLAILEYSVKTLLPYQNVEQFLFQNDADIVTNLYNYKDYTHYSADVNTYMVNCFKDGTHRLTTENYEDELSKMRSLVNNFDFGLFFGESNPFIKENDFSRYLEQLNSTRYITFITAQEDAPIAARDIFDDRYEQLGLDGDKKGCSYVAIVRGSEAICQVASDDAVSMDETIENLAVSIKTEKRGGNKYIEIVIDGISYTTNQAGVNIVVYDTELDRVMDNIAVNIDHKAINRK